MAAAEADAEATEAKAGTASGAEGLEAKATAAALQAARAAAAVPAEVAAKAALITRSSDSQCNQCFQSHIRRRQRQTHSGNHAGSTRQACRKSLGSDRHGRHMCPSNLLRRGSCVPLLLETAWSAVEAVMELADVRRKAAAARLKEQVARVRVTVELEVMLVVVAASSVATEAKREAEVARASATVRRHRHVGQCLLALTGRQL